MPRGRPARSVHGVAAPAAGAFSAAGVAAVVAGVVTVGAAALVGRVRPPDRPPAYAGPRPDTDGEPDRRMVVHREVRRVALDRDRYLAWADSAPLDDILGGDPRVPAVVRTEPVAGVWNRPGARRRVVLADGHFAAEEVLGNGVESDGAHVFRYVVFGYTNDAGLVIDHGVGQFRTTAVGPGAARIEWTYGFRPRAGAARPLVGAFVGRVWAPYMATVLDGMVAKAERDCGERGRLAL